MKNLFHGTLFPGTGGFFVQVAQKPEYTPGVFCEICTKHLWLDGIVQPIQKHKGFNLVVCAYRKNDIFFDKPIEIC